MTVDDACPYIIVSESDLMFSTLIKLNVNKIQNADVVLLKGDSLEVIKE